MPAIRLREGEMVEIVTVDRGRGERCTNHHLRAPIRTERWRAVMLGPSALPGWWIVKKLKGDRPQGGSYTVPDSEIMRVVRSP